MVLLKITEENSSEDLAGRRHGHSASYHDGKMYVFGGSSGSKCLNDVCVFDLGARTWSKLTAKGDIPTGRYHHTATIIHENLLIFGGRDFERSFNDVYVLRLGDEGAAEWKKLDATGDIPSPRNGHTAVLFENKVHVWGGTSSGDEKGSFESICVLELGTNVWSQESVITPDDSPLKSRFGHTASLVGPRLFIFGGDDGSGPVPNDIVSIDLRNMKVSHHDWVEGDSPCKRIGHTATLISNYVIVFGGFGPDETDLPSLFLNDMYALDTDTLKWRLLKRNDPMAFAEPQGRAFHSCCLADETLVIYGGEHGESFHDLYICEWESLGIYDVQASTFLQDMRVLLQSGQGSDASCLSSDGTSFAVHSPIIAVRCPPLSARLKNNAQLDIPSPVLRALLEYIYADTVPADLATSYLPDLLDQASRLGLSRLKALCLQQLHEDLAPANAVLIYSKAFDLNLKGLRLAAINLIEEHYKIVSETREFKSLASTNAPAFESLRSRIRDDEAALTQHRKRKHDEDEAILDKAKREIHAPTDADVLNGDPEFQADNVEGQEVNDDDTANEH